MKRDYSSRFVALAVFYTVALVVSNIIAGKLFTLGGVVLPAAVFLFPIVYILDDVIPEVYGWRAARTVIWFGFAANLFAVCFFLLTLALPAPGFWKGQAAFVTVLGFTPRLLAASFTAYLVGTHVNAWIMVWMRRLTGGRWLWTRTVGSTIVGESLDSTIFMTFAFYGVVPMVVLPGMILAQATFKIAYEAAATPLTYLVIGMVQKAEGREVTGLSF